MKSNTKLNKQKLLKAMISTFGMVTQACEKVNLSRDTFYRYYNEDPEFKKQIDDINEQALDFVETALLRKINEGSEKSIHFYLKYKAKKRGYDSSVDLNVNGGDANITVIKINTNHPDGGTDN